MDQKTTSAKGDDALQGIEFGVPYAITTNKDYEEGRIYNLQYGFRPLNVHQYDDGELTISESSSGNHSAKVRLSSKGDDGDQSNINESFNGPVRDVSGNFELLLHIRGRQAVMSKVERVITLRHEMKISDKISTRDSNPSTAGSNTSDGPAKGIPPGVISQRKQQARKRAKSTDGDAGEKDPSKMKRTKK